MALNTNTVYKKTVMGNTRVHFGRFTKTFSGTTETFVTGLKRLDYFTLEITGSGTTTYSAPQLSSASTFPLATGSVVVYFEGGTTTGIWKAEGL